MEYITRKRLTVRKAALAAGLSPNTLFKAIAAGEIPAVRPGSRNVYVDPRDVETWLQTKRIVPSTGNALADGTWCKPNISRSAR